MGKKKGNKGKTTSQTTPQQPIQPQKTEQPKAEGISGAPSMVASRKEEERGIGVVEGSWTTASRGRGRGQGNVPGVVGYGRGRGDGRLPQTQPRPGPSTSSTSLEGRQEPGAKGRGDGAKPTQSLELCEIAKQLPHAPGSAGTKIRIETNHVRLNLGNLTSAFRYDVTVAPDKKPKRFVRLAMELFRKSNFPNNYPSYDGQKLLYSAKKLDEVAGKVVVPIDETKSLEFDIAIRLTGVIDLSPLRNLLQKKNINDNDEAFQCIEVVLRQSYVNSFINVGRRFYQPSDQFGLGSGAQMYLGGYQAVVQGWIPFLNVDVAHKAFTTETSLPDLVIEMFSTRYKPLTHRDLPSFPVKGWQYEQLSKYLKGLKVIYKIPNHPGSKKVYRVNGLAKPSAEETFELNGRRVSVEDYFRSKWRCNLKYPNLPTVWVGQKTRICLPLEYCTLQKGQPIGGEKLLPMQTSKMISHSATSTTERKKKIESVMHEADCNNNLSVKEFGVSIGAEFERLDARVLPAPLLEYRSKERVQPQKGAWYGKIAKEGAQIKTWVVVSFGLQQQRVSDKINELIRMLMQFGIATGMSFAKPEPPSYISNKVSDLTSFLEKRKSYDLIVVAIMPDTYNYNSVKQTAEQTVGCLTQCVKSETLNRLSDSIVRNILLKINSKLNGTNHILADCCLISNEPTMVMGADVTHPGPQSPNISSVVAVTASHDLFATKYNFHVQHQPPRTHMSEIIQQLDVITVTFLKRFRARTGQEPKRIYFIRDGVSDGEFARVKQVEIEALRKGCNDYRRGFRPKITFVVVQKRHHTRFFPTDENSSGKDRNNNTPPGTCVDTVIVDPTYPNFYLQSHAPIKGVSRPTKYCVLVDDNRLSSDDFQKLMYGLCHVYTRCNRGVSYPAPTYYAHWVAKRAKGYLQGRTIDVENLDQNMLTVVKQFAERNPMYFC